MDDLMRLAAALDVSPVVLLMPEQDATDCDEGGLVSLFDPDEELPAVMVWEWITGQAPLVDDAWLDDLERQETEKPEDERRWYDEAMRLEWRSRFAPKFAWKKENDDGAQ